MKKFIALIGLVITSLTLTGCDLGFNFGGGVSLNTIEEFVEYMNSDDFNAEGSIEMEEGTTKMVLTMKIDGNKMCMSTFIDSEEMRGTEEVYYSFSETEMTIYAKDEEKNWVAITSPYESSEEDDFKVEDFEENEDGTYSLVNVDPMMGDVVIVLGSNPSVTMNLFGLEFKFANFGKVNITLPTIKEPTTPEGGSDLTTEEIAAIDAFLTLLNTSDNMEITMDFFGMGTILSKIDGNKVWMKTAAMDPETGELVETEMYALDNGDGTMDEYTKDENGSWVVETKPIEENDTTGGLDLSTLSGENFTKNSDGTFSFTDASGQTIKITLGDNAKLAMGMEMEGQFYEMMSIYNVGKVSVTLPTVA